MKKIIRYLLIFVLVAVIFTSSATVSFAASVPQENSVQVADLYPIAYGVYYAPGEYPSLNAVKDVYGYGFDYQPCQVMYEGNAYNYYYTLNGGTIYFQVACYDDNLIITSSGTTNDRE